MTRIRRAGRVAAICFACTWHPGRGAADRLRTPVGQVLAGWAGAGGPERVDGRERGQPGSAWSSSTPPTALPPTAPEPMITYRIRLFCRATGLRPDTVTIMDYRLELVQVPVSDVERAKAFYLENAGFTLDMDAEVPGGIRFIQLTPPGSPASIAIGTGLSRMAPGSVEGLQLVVTDVHAARAELAGRGVAVSDVQVYDWGTFVYFTDPDGNGWAVQQLPADQGSL